MRARAPQGSLQGPSEDQTAEEVAAVKVDRAFDPALILRDDREEARAANLDHRFNHWTAVIIPMSAHADIFLQAAIVKTLQIRSIR